MLKAGSSIDRSKLLLSGGCDIVLVGVAPFKTREGDDTGPRDLRGEEPMFVLMGERDRGGNRFFTLRARPITSVGSRFVPVIKGLSAIHSVALVSKTPRGSSHFDRYPSSLLPRW